ncbi:hypothetical protein U1Q18_043471, partial [Sarracenia purpurea var. burkii]
LPAPPSPSLSAPWFVVAVAPPASSRHPSPAPPNRSDRLRSGLIRSSQIVSDLVRRRRLRTQSINATPTQPSPIVSDLFAIFDLLPRHHLLCAPSPPSLTSSYSRMENKSIS